MSKPKLPKPGETCENCKWFVPAEEVDASVKLTGLGECRRFPASVYVDGDSRLRFVPMDPVAWCGEWTKKK